MAENHVLVIDDDRPTATVVGDIVRRQGHSVTIASSFDEALRVLAGSSRFNVVISDINLDHQDGTLLVGPIKAANPQSQVIFLTGYGNIDGAVKALHDGAFDYLSKPMDLALLEIELPPVLNKAIRQIESAQNRPELVRAADGDSQRSIIGKSAQMVRIYYAVAKASLNRENVLISGESGTGKELIAKAIHEKSPWKDKPFVTVNCCALTETLLESELFGHTKGSFTGAICNKKGLFELANGGTLFLDEIGDISPAMQVKLLRVIQDGEIRAVGASESMQVDVRVVAATHRNLAQRVADGLFREDLYYRLKVILIDVPPLRSRKSDLPDLIHYFVRRFLKRTHKSAVTVSPEAMSLLLDHSWPGNIRELENAVGRAISMSSTSLLYPEDFPEEIRRQAAMLYTAPLSQPDTTVSNPTPESLEEVEKKHILKTLESVNYNKSRAAEILGIDRVTLYRRANRYGLLKAKLADVV